MFTKYKSTLFVIKKRNFETHCQLLEYYVRFTPRLTHEFLYFIFSVAHTKWNNIWQSKHWINYARQNRSSLFCVGSFLVVPGWQEILLYFRVSASIARRRAPRAQEPQGLWGKAECGAVFYNLAWDSYEPTTYPGVVYPVELNLSVPTWGC